MTASLDVGKDWFPLPLSFCYHIGCQPPLTHHHHPPPSFTLSLHLTVALVVVCMASAIRSYLWWLSPINQAFLGLLSSGDRNRPSIHSFNSQGTISSLQSPSIRYVAMMMVDPSLYSLTSTSLVRDGQSQAYQISSILHNSWGGKMLDVRGLY